MEILDKQKKLGISICIPTYNGIKWVEEALESILSQKFQKYEIIISDDCSTDGTIDVIKSFKDKRIIIFKNKKNLGYGKNMQVLTSKAKKEILFLMAQDDILSKDSLQKTHDAFFLDEDVGVVARPYYQFIDDVKKPVRVIFPYDKEKDVVINVLNNKKAIYSMFDAVGQLSGLAYFRKYLDTPFHEEVFPSHIYPFASIAKKHKVAFLKDYTVAVRIPSSQTRFKSSIYDISPTESWVKMINIIFSGSKYTLAKKYALEQAATNFVGLVQIRNYARYRYLFREIYFLLKYRWRNVFNVQFWFFTLGSIFMPPFLLIPLVDWYKNKVNYRRFKNIRLGG